MSNSSTSSGHWTEGLAAACDRLIDPAVTDTDERRTHRRLVGVLLGTPFILSGLVCQVFFGTIENGTLLALVCVLFAAAWMGAAVVASMGKVMIVQSLLLIVSTLIIGLSISASGLLQSPLVLLLLAPPFECWWLHRSRGTSNKGWWASIGACAFALLSVGGGLETVRGFSEHLWAIPLIYAATMWIRFSGPDAESSREVTSEQILEQASDLSGSAMLVVDTGCEISFATRKSASIFAVPPALLLGKGLFDRIHVTDRVQYMSTLADVRADSAPRSVDLRVRVPSVDGGERQSSYQSLQFLFSPDDAADGTLRLLVRNDPETAELKSELAEARDRADSTDIAKGRFLASVSHELRTPLNAIIGFADMLKNEMFGPFPDPRQKEYVELIGQSGSHLLSVVNAILDVSKIESGNYLIEPEPFVFNDAIEMCHSMMVLQAKAKNISITRDIDKSVGEICADRRAVQQILINLVSNAIKFTPESGRVHINADVKEDRLRFHINDNGIGISAEDLQRIGQPFMQVQNDYTRQFEGTGLGLSLVKGLVSLHQGEMLVDSAPGCGTTVSISLPIDGPGELETGDVTRMSAKSTGEPGEMFDEAARKQA